MNQKQKDAQAALDRASAKLAWHQRECTSNDKRLAKIEAQYQEAKAASETSAAGLKAAEATVKKAKAALTRAKRSKKRKTVKKTAKKPEPKTEE
jgi:chromosome segregation ATPase